jgi:hypothetical protein
MKHVCYSGKTAHILDAAPYICLKEVSKEPQPPTQLSYNFTQGMIGDEVLRRILHVGLFGDSKPSVLDPWV